jgi:hypothetical protein
MDWNSKKIKACGYLEAIIHLSGGSTAGYYVDRSFFENMVKVVVLFLLLMTPGSIFLFGQFPEEPLVVPDPLPSYIAFVGHLEWYGSIQAGWLGLVRISEGRVSRKNNLSHASKESHLVFGHETLALLYIPLAEGLNIVVILCERI